MLIKICDPNALHMIQKEILEAEILLSSILPWPFEPIYRQSPIALQAQLFRLSYLSKERETKYHTTLNINYKVVKEFFIFMFGE